MLQYDRFFFVENMYLQHTPADILPLQNRTSNEPTRSGILPGIAGEYSRKSALMCCSVLQCVAVCYSVLQCVAVCFSVLQCVTVCCSVLQCAAVCCSVLQCVAVCCSVNSAGYR